MNREDVIEKLVDQYREQLEEKDDEDLLGSRLETIREAAKLLLSNRLESERDETIERLVEQYQEELKSKSDEELFGENKDDSEK